jgi:YesN/AraC family two-component response regulator
MYKVMIIEDEPLIALDLTKILERKSFEVTGHAGNFEDAYILFNTHKPNIVLSDIKLENDESGIEVVKKLKKINDFCVIYLTSYGDDAMIEKALQTNPAAYITKPFKEIDFNASLKLASSSIKN